MAQIARQKGMYPTDMSLKASAGMIHAAMNADRENVTGH